MTDLTKPRLPRGLADRGPADLAATARITDAIRATYELYGFEAVETPIVEYTDALGKFLPDLDRPNAGVFSFRDDDDQWLSLRYDLTAPLARSFAERYDALPKPYRSYRFGPVFRNEKPGPGRFRQFLQFDADTVGSASIAADAEICMMAADTMEQLGIKRGDYVIRVNNRKLLDGVMEGAGLGGPENAARRLTVMRALDKYDRLGWDGVHALLGAGRRDDSGDVTKGADLSFDQMIKVTSVFVRGNLAEAFRRISKIILETFTDPKSFEDAFESVRATIEAQFHVESLSAPEGWVLDGGEIFFPLQIREKTYKFFSRNRSIIETLRGDFKTNKMYNEGVTELEQMVELFDAAGYGSRRILIDPSVVRGLEYYTGPVFEAELLFEVKDDEGQPVRFGSVGGGGRYDGLVARFRGEPVPATGFSVGVSRLVAALRAVGSPLLGGAAPRGPVVVAVLDRGEMARYQGLVTRLRAAGIAAELYLGASGMNAQLKYADRRGSPCAVLQGSNERDAAGGPMVMIRDLVLGAELAKGSKDRANYLELRQRAQFPVPEGDMVAAVHEVLARHLG